MGLQHPRFGAAAWPGHPPGCCAMGSLAGAAAAQPAGAAPVTHGARSRPAAQR